MGFSKAWSALAALGLVALCVSRPALALTLTPMNHATDETVSGTRTIYFPIRGGVASCQQDRTHPASLSVLDSTSTSEPGLKFTVRADKTLSTIYGGTPATNQDVAVRVEYSGNGIALHDYTGGGVDCPNPCFWPGYGTTEGANKIFGIKFKDTGNQALCDRVYGAGTACTLPGLSGAPSPITLTVALVPKLTTISASAAQADVATINVMLVDCPPHLGGSLTFPSLNFSLIPGDERIRMVNASSAPYDPVGLKSVVVFATTTSTDPAISNTSGDSGFRTEFGNTGGGSYTLEGIRNDVRHCFALGYVNKGGLVSTGASWGDSIYTGSTNEGSRCATASQVAGFLDRSTCFIASAAYGNEWDQRLEVLRQFRDQVLLRTRLGSMFVDWYYGWSPRAAFWILDRPGVQSAIRLALIPLVQAANATLWLRSNLWVALMLFGFGTILAFLLLLRRSAA